MEAVTKYTKYLKKNIVTCLTDFTPAMKINILEFIEGARNARGLTIIIDVFRAFSVACYALDAGAARLVIVKDIESAFELKRKCRRSYLIGERDERKIPGFDFGNSPTEIIKVNLEGYTVIQTTTAGTNGLVNAVSSSALLAGSLVNARATINYIKATRPDEVSLVAMGYRASTTAEEDILCARIIADGLKDINSDYSEEISGLREGAGKRFFDPSNLEFSPPTDFFLCTMLNRFDFVLRAEKRLNGNIDLIRTEI